MEQSPEDRLNLFADQLIDIASRAEQLEFVQRVYKLKQERGRTMRHIAMIGEVGNGKSTIINALLSRPFLPTNIFVLTQYYLVLVNEPGKLAVAYYRTGQIKPLPVSPDQTFELPATMELKYIEIPVTSERLPAGAHLLVAPGLGQIDPKHQRIAETVVSQVDSLILIRNSTAPLTKHEHAILQRLPGQINRLAVLVNRANVSDPDQRERIRKSIFQNLQMLRVPTNPAVFVVSGAEPLDSEEKHSTPFTADDEWTNFTKLLLSWQTSTVGSLPNTSEQFQSELRKAARELENMLSTTASALRSGAAYASDPPNGRRLADMQKTRSVLSKVISDQSEDILQTVQNSFSAAVFNLEKLNDPEQQMNGLKNTFETETDRVSTRLRQLFKTVLNDISYATGANYDIEPRVPTLNFANDTATGQEIPTRVRLGIAGLGGLAAGSIFYSLSFPYGLVVSASIAAITIWLLGKTSSKESGQHGLSEMSNQILPVFRNVVQQNAQRLQELIEEAFDAVEHPVRGYQASGKINPQHEALLDEIAQIRQGLG